jgi:hypothetical protein
MYLFILEHNLELHTLRINLKLDTYQLIIYRYWNTELLYYIKVINYLN